MNKRKILNLRRNNVKNNTNTNNRVRINKWVELNTKLHH